MRWRYETRPLNQGRLRASFGVTHTSKKQAIEYAGDTMSVIDLSTGEIIKEPSKPVFDLEAKMMSALSYALSKSK